MIAKKALEISLIYLFIGCLWILWSDEYVFDYFKNIGEIEYIGKIKGLGFVIISSSLIYFLVAQFFKEDRKKRMELDSLLMNPDIGRMVTDSDGWILHISGNFKEWFGSDINIEGKHFNDLIKAEKYHLKFSENNRSHITAKELLIEAFGQSVSVEITGGHSNNFHIFYFIRVDEKVAFKQRLESELQQKNSLINNTNDFIWSIDTDFRLVTFNEAYKQTIQSVSQREIKEGDPVIIKEFGPELRDKWEKLYKRALSGESFKTLEHVVIAGEDSYGEISFHPISNEDKIIGVSCFNRDVTQLKLTEIDLIKETERLKVAQKTGSIGDWEYDLENEDIFWSDQVYDLFGMDPSGPVPDLPGILDMFEPKSKIKLEKAIERATNDAEEYDIKLELLPNKNERKFIRAIGKSVTDKSKQAVKLLGIVQDITSLEMAEIERRKYFQRLEAVNNNLPGAIFQYKLKNNGDDELLYLSKGAKNLWGIEPEEAMQDNSKIWEQIIAEDLPLVKQSIRKSAEQFKPWEYEWRSKKLTGELRWHKGSGIPRQEDSSIIWDSIIIDVTESKEFEMALKDREAHLEMIYKNAFDGILTCDEKGKINIFNKKLEEWFGTIREDISPEDYAASFGLYTFNKTRLLKKEELFKALETGSLTNHRFIIINENSPDGKYVEANGSVFKNEKGEVKGAVIIIRDITEQYSNEMRLNDLILEALENERQSIASVLHDSIVQSLGIASMNLRNFLLDWKEKENNNLKIASEYIDLSIDQSRNLAHDLMPRSIGDFGLVGAAEELVDLYNEKEEFKTFFSTNEEQRVDPEIETQMFRVIQEALTNVKKHAHAKTCNVSILFTQNDLTINIIDDGRGFRDNSHQTGIGLITMRNRLRKLNGIFEVDSDKSGTSITVQCPC